MQGLNSYVLVGALYPVDSLLLRIDAKREPRCPSGQYSVLNAVIVGRQAAGNPALNGGLSGQQRFQGTGASERDSTALCIRKQLPFQDSLR
jgi:hypothetical protein